MRPHSLAAASVALFATLGAYAAPARPLGAGTRALVLEYDRASGVVMMGERDDHVGAVSIDALIIEGRLLVSPDLRDFGYAPTRWRVDVVRVNRVGVTIRRELPQLGAGLPPVAIAVELDRIKADEHLRVQFSVDAGRFDGSTSAPVFVPPLPTPLPVPPSVATLSIDGRDGRLPVGHSRVTFDLDVPATVTLRAEDARGTRWLRRAISAVAVTRPIGGARASKVRIHAAQEALQVGTAIIPLPARGPRVTSAGRGLNGAWATLAGAGDATGWRAVFGDAAGARIVRFGVGPAPAQVSVIAAERLDWIELEQSFHYGMRGVSARTQLSASPAPEAPLALVIDAGAIAGDIVRVGTSTGARVFVAVPDVL